MTVRGRRASIKTATPCEILESRQRMAAPPAAQSVSPALSPTSEIHAIHHASPPPKASAIFIEPTAGSKPLLAAMIAGHLAYLGSIDLVTSENSSSRELGITFSCRSLVPPLRSQFQGDCASSTPLASIASGV